MSDGLADLVGLWEAVDRDELWRSLLLYPGPQSTYHAEAVQLFRRHHEDGTPDALTTAQLLCTDRRWERGTARLVRGIEETSIIGDADADELAGSFLWADHLTFNVPLGWFGTEIIIDVGDGVEGVDDVDLHLDPDTPVPIERIIPPPLRRWAAARLLRTDPGTLDAMWARALEADPLDGSAILSGMLDAVDALDHELARRAIYLGLGWSRGSVRLIALDLLAARDPEAARRRAAADPDKKVRAWVRRRDRTSVTSTGRAGPRPGGRPHPHDPDDLQIELFGWETLSEDDPADAGRRPPTDDA